MFRMIFIRTLSLIPSAKIFKYLIALIGILGVWLLFNKQTTILTELKLTKDEIHDLKRQVMFSRLSQELNDDINVKFYDLTKERIVNTERSRSEAIDEYITASKEDDIFVLGNLHDRLRKQYGESSEYSFNKNTAQP